MQKVTTTRTVQLDILCDFSVAETSQKEHVPSESTSSSNTIKNKTLEAEKHMGIDDGFGGIFSLFGYHRSDSEAPQFETAIQDNQASATSAEIPSTSDGSEALLVLN
nr:protein TPX2-like [Tanacetum cinerariifolium]